MTRGNRRLVMGMRNRRLVGVRGGGNRGFVVVRRNMGLFEGGRNRRFGSGLEELEVGCDPEEQEVGCR